MLAALVLLAELAACGRGPACPHGAVNTDASAAKTKPVCKDQTIHELVVQREVTRYERPCMRGAPPAAPTMIGDPAIDAARRLDDQREFRTWAGYWWRVCGPHPVPDEARSLVSPVRIRW